MFNKFTGSPVSGCAFLQYKNCEIVLKFYFYFTILTCTDLSERQLCLVHLLKLLWCQTHFSPQTTHTLASTGYRLGVKSGSEDRKSTRLNSSHVKISYAVFCLKKKKRRREGVPLCDGRWRGRTLRP